MLKKGIKPIVAITMGDPAGVGPEIIVKTLAHIDLRNTARFLVIGDLGIMERAIKITDLDFDIVTVTDAADTGDDPGIIYLYDLGNVDRDTFSYGRLSAMCGQAAFEAIEKAIMFAMQHLVDATVTAPLNKEALNLAGIRFAGHTEIFADKTGTHDYTMMLVHDSLRVVHVSTHVSLRDACDRVTRDRIAKVIHLAYDTLRSLGIENPRIAVAGLNPHAGENGMFGREEIEQILPAVEAAVVEGMNVTGPLPPDTIFPRAAAGDYDCVVAMYHDQGHIPLKMLGFTYDRAKSGFTEVKGVNITLGLPIVRTSVDHGTAFDKAGTGTASEASMVEAIRLAVQLTQQKSEKE